MLYQVQVEGINHQLWDFLVRLEFNFPELEVLIQEYKPEGCPLEISVLLPILISALPTNIQEKIRMYLEFRSTLGSEMPSTPFLRAQALKN